MRIRYGCELAVAVDRPTPIFCLVDIHPDHRGNIISEAPLAVVPGVPVSLTHDLYGNRLARFVAQPGDTQILLSGVVADDGLPDARDPNAVAWPVTELPADVVTFLNGSRYCETDRLGSIAWNTFGHMRADARMVQAICDFVHGHLRFDYQLARATRTALEAYEERVGVCRDFAHLAVTLCRCMNIPARYVNGYLGDIGVPPDPAPMDFNAWFQVFLGGAWQTYDARHNERRIGRLPIAYGRDAADVPMIQTFGPHLLKTFRVITEEVADAAAAQAAA